MKEKKIYIYYELQIWKIILSSKTPSFYYSYVTVKYQFMLLFESSTLFLISFALPWFVVPFPPVALSVFTLCGCDGAHTTPQPTSDSPRCSINDRVDLFWGGGVLGDPKPRRAQHVTILWLILYPVSRALLWFGATSSVFLFSLSFTIK